MSASDTSDGFRGWWAAPPGLWPSSQAHCCSRWAGHTPCRPLVLRLTISRHRLRDGVAGDDEQAPGTPLAPGNDAPDWVREQGGRLIAEQNGVELYVTRVDTAERGTLLNFTIGDGVAIGGTIDDWRERFDDQAVVVLGAANFGSFRDMLDERGRFPLLGVTARSVDRVELRYAQGPPLRETDVEGALSSWPTRCGR
jgi:hypothetical protein